MEQINMGRKQSMLNLIEGYIILLNAPNAMMRNAFIDDAWIKLINANMVPVRSVIARFPFQPVGTPPGPSVMQVDPQSLFPSGIWLTVMGDPDHIPDINSTKNKLNALKARVFHGYINEGHFKTELNHALTLQSDNPPHNPVPGALHKTFFSSARDFNTNHDAQEAHRYRDMLVEKIGEKLLSK